jgi:hypothetical protein
MSERAVTSVRSRTLAGPDRRFACVAVAALLAPASAIAQALPGSAAESENLLELVFDDHSQRRDGVNFWAERVRGLEIPGMSQLPGGGTCVNCIVRQVEAIQSPAGQQRLTDRVMSLAEVMTFIGGFSGDPLIGLGVGLIGMQGLVNSELGGVLPALPDAWIDPYRMFAVGGIMVLAGAQAGREAAQSLATSNQQAQQQANERSTMASQVTDVGVATMSDGRRARAFANTDLNVPMGDVGDGQTAVLTSATAYVDAQQLVMIGHRLEGTMQDASGASRPFYIEVLGSDFREVPGCNLYEPYRRVMRMGGVLDETQTAEMEEARLQLAEFEQQLAAMPPAQRAMMENMIGSQMDTVRNMAESGAIEHVQETEEIICNPDLRAMFSPADPALELAQIQRDLVTLGYTPGNTDGVLDTLTEIAISQFQAEQGMAVTGQPSTDLALALSSAAAGQG